MTSTDEFTDCTCGERIYRAVNGNWYHWACDGMPTLACGTDARRLPDGRAIVQAPEGSDLAAAAAAEQDANARADLASRAYDTALAEYKRAQAAYDQASEDRLSTLHDMIDARKAHIAAMRAAGVAQTADGYVTR